MGLGISITLCLERLLGKDEKNFLKKIFFESFLSLFLVVVTGLGKNSFLETSKIMYVSVTVCLQYT